MAAAAPSFNVTKEDEDDVNECNVLLKNDFLCLFQNYKK